MRPGWWPILRGVKIAAGVVVCVLMLAGCSTGGGGAVASSTPAAAQPVASAQLSTPFDPSTEGDAGLTTAPTSDFPNPVDLILKAGCTPAAGVTNGQLSLDGTFKVASCSYPSQMDITVDTFRSADDLSVNLAADEQGGAQDGRAIIVVSDPLAVVLLTTSTNFVFYPEVATVAALVGGIAQQQ